MMMLILTSKELCQSYGGGKMTLNIMSMPLIMMAMEDENKTVEASTKVKKWIRKQVKSEEENKWINSQSLEDTQVGYISQKYTLDKYTLEK